MRLLDTELVEAEFLRMRQRELRMANLVGLIHLLTSLLSDPIGVKPACERVARTIVEESGSEHCILFLQEPDADTLVPVVSVSMVDLLDDGASTGGDRPPVFTPEPAQLLDVLSRRETLVLDSPVSPLRWNDPPPNVPAMGNSLIVPLLDLGVMVLLSCKSCGLSAQETRDWTMLGSIVAQIIQTEMLHERLSMDNRGLRLEIDVKNRELERRYKELASANRFLEQVIDHCPEGMCVLDAEGMAVRMNRQMMAFRGESAQDLLGRSPAVIFQDPGKFLNLFPGGVPWREWGAPRSPPDGFQRNSETRGGVSNQTGPEFRTPGCLSARALRPDREEGPEGASVTNRKACGPGDHGGRCRP